MTSTFTQFYQAFLIFLQVLNAINPEGLPVGWRNAFTGLLSAAMAIQGVLAHYYTPAGNKIDGTTGAVTAAGTTTVIANVPATKQ
jgi:hypothetical protein